eukprot:CAMPEP_0170528292 /NCGR_PEP_ID=MMETSP0209-20121228/13799_1 /TAXON_ID=665100 ORGANISM="Litonotus pictus, Strain P1" /NCGR_SAMPLE_ID=MMETSP0209 /ASSEMBLY_ACC=CAM_ASM_000301 /LENGTH=85 /DNA_ID=CAMNT_0010819415 /DNA_START=269 /DNA_END=523 /DNA_ORIENTATION=-
MALQDPRDNGAYMKRLQTNNLGMNKEDELNENPKRDYEKKALVHQATNRGGEDGEDKETNRVYDIKSTERYLNPKQVFTALKDKE